MTSLMIIEGEVFSKRGSRFWYGCVGLEIHLLVFDGAPQPFDEHVVPPTPLAIHADVDRVGLQAVRCVSRQLPVCQEVALLGNKERHAVSMMRGGPSASAIRR